MQNTINSMNNIKVSILVPIYNVEQFIRKCAVSLFEQTYGNIEYIFVNDCTPDDSIEILKTVMNDYPERMKDVRIISHETNQGLAIARNTAISNATGEYICHVDSDDYIPSDSIENLVNNAIKTNADIVYGNCIGLRGRQEHLFRQIHTSSVDEYMGSVLTRRSMVNIWGKLIRKSLYSPDILLDKEDSFGEDYLTLPKLIIRSKTVSHEDSVVYFYVECRTGSYCYEFNQEIISKTRKCEEKLISWFKEQRIHKYDQYLKLGTFYNKAGLIEHSPLKYYKYIQTLYPNIVPFSFLSKIDLKHLLILILFELRLFKIIQHIVHIKNKCQ